MKEPLKEPLRILAVDDDVEILRFLKTYFERKGYRVHTADSGEKALPIIIAEKPDIMLLDLNLPSLDGVELLQLVRGFNQAITVIVVSGSQTELETDERLRNLAVADFLYKPVSFGVLENSIEKAAAKAKSR